MENRDLNKISQWTSHWRPGDPDYPIVKCPECDERFWEWEMREVEEVGQSVCHRCAQRIKDEITQAYKEKDYGGCNVIDQ